MNLNNNCNVPIVVKFFVVGFEGVEEEVEEVAEGKRITGETKGALARLNITTPAHTKSNIIINHSKNSILHKKKYK